MGGSRNDAQPGKAPLSAAEVGGSFVLQYYRTLTTDRENLHKYYKDESICSRGVEGANPDRITYSTGVDEIRDSVSAHFERGVSRTEINCIQSMDSKQGGILVLVLGYFVYSDSSEKAHFTQVFFLDKQTDPYPGYFVQNDIFRYVTGNAEGTALYGSMQAAQLHNADPPPLLPPPQPPMGLQPEVVNVPAQEEEQLPEEMPEEEEEEEEPYMPPPQDNTANGGAVAEAVAAAAAEEAAQAAAAAEAVPMIPGEKAAAPSWASMAGKLKEGGGKLGPPAKLQGWSLPAAAKAKGTSLPPAAAPKYAAASSTTPVLPPPSTAHKAKAKAAEAGQDVAEVRLWVSRIPLEQPVEDQELADSFSKLNPDAFVEIDRKDPTKDWAYITVWGQDVADSFVQHSKDRKVQVRGKILKVQLATDEKPDRRKPNNSGKSSGKGGGEDGADPKSADSSAGGGRGSRRGKGGKGAGDSGGKGGKGGRGGDKGGSKGEGNWRSQS